MYEGKVIRPKVMVVDDDVKIVELYIEILSAKYEVFALTDANEVPGFIDFVDACILDYHIPGSNFDDLVKLCSQKPILVVTANPKSVFPNQLKKPFKRDVLMARVSELVTESRAAFQKALASNSA